MATNVYGSRADIHPTRHELLAWVNGTLASKFTKIEELRTGAAYCQLMDMLFPQAMVRMRKVTFCTIVPHESWRNFRLLQDSFNAMQVDKKVPVKKLVEGSFKDNLNFLQWFKQFYDANYTGRAYDAVAERNGSPMGFWDRVAAEGRVETAKAGGDGAASSAAQSGQRKAANGDEAALLQQQIHKLETEVCHWRQLVTTMEAKRNLCFERLRDVDKLCRSKYKCDSSLGRAVRHVLSGFDEEMKSCMLEKPEKAEKL